MNSSDQQYPYGRPYDAYGDPGAPPQPPADPYAGQPYEGQPYEGQPYQDQPHADPYAGQYADPAPAFGPEQPYGDPGAAPYDPRSAWPTHQAQQPLPVPPEDHGHAGQGAAQTWQGQTWDTRYQPAVRQHPPQQSPSGSYPLPPETPVAPAAPAAPGPEREAATYSAPSIAGNARITDAQRARAEGRSPVIAPGMQPAGLTAALGLLVALGASIGPYALLVPLVLLQAVTAAGWFRLNGMWPARQGIALAFMGGVAADVALLAAGRENAAAALLGTLGVWVLLTLVLQLRSHAGADERMYGLMATVVSAALAVLAAGHLASVPDAVTVGGVAVATAVLARALPLPGAASVVVALLASAGAGVAMGGFTDFGSRAAFLGLAAGGCALVGLRVASYDYPSRFVHMTAGVALPLTAAAPAVFLIGRALA
ncbi:hypothetical protein F0344_15885 [Streptomyces finlayi]|uniref:Peptidase C83 domain-containing protein n=1 Tax=Streptomyces finlayi TaxID=67296 RepID=A0A7G7BKQ5_9ACTN|nr:hypothetical protein [Streptomyces finlayi]QNE75920.1 hypothetical protein F0344_15885 [Streptomyces finlayi]